MCLKDTEHLWGKFCVQTKPTLCYRNIYFKYAFDLKLIIEMIHLTLNDNMIKYSNFNRPSTAQRIAVCPLSSCSVIKSFIVPVMANPFLFIHSLLPIKTLYDSEATVSADLPSEIKKNEIKIEYIE